jgi:large subunit ribosomal protein L25
MSTVLTAETGRTIGSRSTGRLRAQGKIPGILYGKGVETTPIAVDARAFRTAMHSEMGSNVALTLVVDGVEHLALARELQRDTVRGTVTHIDFLAVDRNVVVTADVPIVLIGEHDLGDEVMVALELTTLAISAKPESIPAAIEIDQSTFQIGTQLHVKDLPLPAGVETALDPEETVVKVSVAEVDTESDAGEAEGEGEAGEAEAPAAES